MTFNFYAKLLALNSDKVNQLPTVSRLKLITLGQLMLIPITLWFISGFLISINLIQISLSKSLLTGLICAVLIYIIDRSFITAFDHKHKWVMNGIRIGFAILSAVLGSLALDLVIFEGDIDNFQKTQTEQKARQYEAGFIDDYQDELVALKEEVSQAENRYNKRIVIYTDEIDGKGTGQAGVGAAARAKKATADQAKNHWGATQERYRNRKDEIEKDAAAYAKAQTDIESGAILKKLHDFHQFVASSKLNIVMYLIFFTIMLLIESMLIIYKIGARETFFEKVLRAEEEARKSELESIRVRKQKLEEANRVLGNNRVSQIRKISEPYSRN